MIDVVIFGCGGFGREVLQIVRDLAASGAAWHCAGFLVDPGFDVPAEVQGKPVHHDLAHFGAAADLAVLVAIGQPAARRRATEALMQRGVRHFPSIVHPRAWLGQNVFLAEGVIVCAGALITTDIHISAHCHVNIGTTIGHDAWLGAYCTLSPGVRVSGNVTLHEEVEVGSAASLIPGVTVGARSVIGAGAAVVRDIAPDSLAVGVPAKVIRSAS